jgi:hypothetical protein
VPAPTLGYSGTVHVENNDGYTYDIRFHYAPGTPTTESAHDPPGTTAVLLPVSGSVTLTNTTTGHDLPDSAGGFTVVQLWPMSSAVCAAYAVGPGQYPIIFSVRLTSPKGLYCELPVATSAVPQSIPRLPSSQSTTSKLVERQVVNATVGNTYGLYPPGDQVFDGVPEARADAFVIALSLNPPIYLLLGRSYEHAVQPTFSKMCASFFKGDVLTGETSLVASSQPIVCARG